MKTILATVPKTMFTLAAIWSVVAGFIIFFTFGANSVTATSETGGQQIVSHISWFEWAGWWGIALLFIFAALFYGVLHFYQRSKITWTVIFGLVVIILSIISGFSIGTVYWLGSLAVLVGLLPCLFEAKLVRDSHSTQPARGSLTS